MINIYTAMYGNRYLITGIWLPMPSLVNTTCISWVSRHEEKKKKPQQNPSLITMEFTVKNSLSEQSQVQVTQTSPKKRQGTEPQSCMLSARGQQPGSSLDTAAVPWLFSPTQSQGTPNTKCVVTVLLQNCVTLYLLIWAKYSVLQKTV